MAAGANTPYSEYLMIDEGYYPEITPNSVKDPKNSWFKTFPHNSFIKLLKALERMLARETSGKKHCIWMQGAFGTGKSRLIWTVRKLMTCTDEELRAYFDEYEDLRKETDLRDKLLGHKHGKIVTAFRYASGDIDTNRKLIMAIFESVTDVLKDAGCDELGQKTLRGQIAIWLEDEGNQQIFQIIINKPQYRSMGSFSGKTPADILSQLQGSAECSSLINDILTVSENEKVGVYDLSIEDLKTWLSEVIDKNQLTSLLFLWDEFSSFFRVNKDALDIFQSLTELCAEKPFEMIIVTHQAGSLANEKDQQFRTIRDRFELIEIEMPDNVAFDLIGGYAIKANPSSESKWKELSDDLAGAASESMLVVQKAAGVKENTLRKMFPIQPMAALMLKYIAESFASNQRSMFNFIKNEDSDDLQAFQWFIKNHTPDMRELLTIDYLWNFFYEKGHDEHSSGAGRSNLDTIIAGILDTYPTNEKKLNEEQRRVLKVVLMMQAISRKRNNGVPLLRPTEKNIKLAFEGDDNFTTAPHLILKNQLVNQLKVLFASPAENGIVEYATAAIQGDQVKIDAIVERFREETRTTKLVKEAELSSAFNWSPAVRARFEFTTVCSENFTNELNKIMLQQPDYHIRGIVCFARNEDEQKKIRALIADARADATKRIVVIIDASGTPMSNDRFDEWCKYAGNEEYWRPKDNSTNGLANNYQRRAKELLDAWKDDLRNGTFLAYYGDIVDKQLCTVKQLNDDVLQRILLSRFPLAFDNARVSENFFHTDKHKDGAKRGIRQDPGGIFQAGDVLPMMKGVWGVPEYWKIPANSTLPIVKLKKELDQFILGRFATDIRISQQELYDFLAEHGGFMPCNLYAFLAGFLLKEYAGEPYRYGIGESGEEGDTMTPEKLGEHIGEYFKLQTQEKRDNKYKDKYIEIMSVEQKAYVDFTVEAFDVPENYSVEKAATRMRSRLKDLRYPVWCYKVIDTHNLSAFIDRIADIANDRGGDNVPSLAKKLGKMLLDFPTASNDLIDLLTKPHGKEAMTLFLQDFRDGQLISLSEEIGASNLMEDVCSMLSSGEALWLWNQDTGEEELDKLITEYRIVSVSNQLAGHDTFDVTHSYSECISAWKMCVKFTHIPAVILREKRPELRRWVDLLMGIMSDGGLPTYEKKQDFLDQLIGKKLEITTFLAERQETFASFYASCLVNLDEESIRRIFYKLPETSFVEDKSIFIKNVNALADQERAAQAKNKLIRCWREVSGYDDPIAWSNHYETPILALVPMGEQDKARQLFSVLIGTAEYNSIDLAMAYLQSPPAFLSALKDQSRIDAEFQDALIGKYHTILSVEEARTELRERSLSLPYYWLDGSEARNIIRDKAEIKYQSGTNETLLQRIDEMDALQAKEYLKRLVRDKLDVGVEIMDEEGVKG